MFVLHAVLVGLGFFNEIELSCLLVSHMHKDIDKKINIISNMLIKAHIDLVNQMFILLEKETSCTEAFVNTQHLEKISD